MLLLREIIARGTGFVNFVIDSVFGDLLGAIYRLIFVPLLIRLHTLVVELLTYTMMPVDESGSFVIFGIPTGSDIGMFAAYSENFMQPISFVVLIVTIITVLFLSIFDKGLDLGLNTDSARQKLLIAPVLVYLWVPIANFVLLFSFGLASIFSPENTSGVLSAASGTSTQAELESLNYENYLNEVVGENSDSQVFTIFMIFAAGFTAVLSYIVAAIGAIIRIFTMSLFYAIGPIAITVWALSDLLTELRSISTTVIKWFILLSIFPAVVTLLQTLLIPTFLLIENMIESMAFQTGVTPIINAILVATTPLIIGILPWGIIIGVNRAKGIAASVGAVSTGVGALAMGAGAAGAAKSAGSVNQKLGNRMNDETDEGALGVVNRRARSYRGDGSRTDRYTSKAAGVGSLSYKGAGMLRKGVGAAEKQAADSRTLQRTWLGSIASDGAEKHIEWKDKMDDKKSLTDWWKHRGQRDPEDALSIKKGQNPLGDDDAYEEVTRASAIAAGEGIESRFSDDEYQGLVNKYLSSSATSDMMEADDVENEDLVKWWMDVSNSEEYDAQKEIGQENIDDVEESIKDVGLSDIRRVASNDEHNVNPFLELQKAQADGNIEDKDEALTKLFGEEGDFNPIETSFSKSLGYEPVNREKKQKQLETVSKSLDDAVNGKRLRAVNNDKLTEIVEAQREDGNIADIKITEEDINEEQLSEDIEVSDIGTTDELLTEMEIDKNEVERRISEIDDTSEIKTGKFDNVNASVDVMTEQLETADINKIETVLSDDGVHDMKVMQNYAQDIMNQINDEVSVAISDQDREQIHEAIVNQNVSAIEDNQLKSDITSILNEMDEIQVEKASRVMEEFDASEINTDAIFEFRDDIDTRAVSSEVTEKLLESHRQELQNIVDDIESGISVDDAVSENLSEEIINEFESNVDVVGELANDMEMWNPSNEMVVTSEITDQLLENYTQEVEAAIEDISNGSDIDTAIAENLSEAIENDFDDVHHVLEEFSSDLKVGLENNDSIELDLGSEINISGVDDLEKIIDEELDAAAANTIKEVGDTDVLKENIHKQMEQDIQTTIQLEPQEIGDIMGEAVRKQTEGQIMEDMNYVTELLDSVDVSIDDDGFNEELANAFEQQTTQKKARILDDMKSSLETEMGSRNIDYEGDELRVDDFDKVLAKLSED